MLRAAYSSAVASQRMTRKESVAANDEALRDAAMAVIGESGWDDLSFTVVAKRAGLTVGAVYGRAESTAELAIDLWQARVAPWLRTAVEHLLDAASAGDAKALARSLGDWHRHPASDVAIELLIAALFDPDLADAIGSDAAFILGSRTKARRSAADAAAHEAACAALVTSFALGRAIAARSGQRPDRLTSGQVQVLSTYYEAKPCLTPPPSGPALTWVRAPSKGSAQEDALAQAALRVIGRVGYRRATIARIAREAGIPRGSVLSHAGDKAHLVAASAAAALNSPLEVWSQYAPVVDDHGPLTSRAMFLAEFLKPVNRPSWALNLELARMSRHIEQLAAFGAGEGVLEQTHLGVMLLACYVPGLARLPFRGPFASGSAT